MLAAGADALKLFPAEAASPAVLRALRAVLPAGTAVLPVGGIDASNMAAWRAAGAAGFGIGSSIYRAGDSPGDGWRQGACAGGGAGGLAGGPSRFFPTLRRPGYEWQPPWRDPDDRSDTVPPSRPRHAAAVRRAGISRHDQAASEAEAASAAPHHHGDHRAQLLRQPVSAARRPHHDRPASRRSASASSSPARSPTRTAGRCRTRWSRSGRPTRPAATTIRPTSTTRRSIRISTARAGCSPTRTAATGS